MKRIIQILLAIVLTCGSRIVVSPNVQAVNCTDLKIIFARGSGEELGDVSYRDWRASLTEQLSISDVSYSFYELGTESHGGARYPAVAVAGSLGGIGNLLGAYVSAGSAFEFGKSVDAGRQELQAYIAEVSRECPDTKFVLGGYSQGAMLISGILPVLDSNRIIYVATFGDPKLYLPEGKGNRPVACQGKNLSNYRAYVSDCHAYEGILGSFRPYQSPEYYDKLGTWCNANDIMCSSGMNLNDHTSYTQKGLYKNAAVTIRSKVKQTWPEKFDPGDATEEIVSSHDVAIVLDVGGAMIFDRLDNYKATARAIANRTYSLGGRVALYYFSGLDKYTPRQKCDFTCTPEEFNRYLDELTSILSYGERYHSGLSAVKTAMTQLEWQVGATKSVILLAAMGYDARDKDGTTVNDVAEISLSIDPVNVYPFVDTDGIREQVAPLAESTNGKVYHLEETEQAADEIIGRPVATLALEEYVGVVGDEFVFDASTAGHGSTVRYDWDLDVDGIFETVDAGNIVSHVYQAPTSGFVQVKLTDQAGYTSTMSARLEVTADTPVAPTVGLVAVNQIDETTYRFEFSDDSEKIYIIVDDAILGYVDTTKQNTITISDLEADSQVRFVASSQAYGRGEAIEYSPSLGLGEAEDEPATQLKNIPLAPNTGVPTISLDASSDASDRRTRTYRR